MSDKEFRDSVLVGAGRNDHDTPKIRAAAARAYFVRELAGAKLAETNADDVLAKAQAHLDGATAAKAALEKARAELGANADAAERLVRDIAAGLDVTEHLSPAGAPVSVQAGVASATGKANS